MLKFLSHAHLFLRYTHLNLLKIILERIFSGRSLIKIFQSKIDSTSRNKSIDEKIIELKPSNSKDVNFSFGIRSLYKIKVL
jgi:hypothetical protein